MPATVLVHESCHFHVEAAILRDLHDAAFAPPADRIQPRGGFLDTERGLRDRIQPEPMAEPLLHVGHQIGGAKFRDQIEDRVTHQHLVIEIQDVESHHEIGAAQPLHQLVDLRFAEHFVASGRGAERDANRHAHVALARPAAGVVRRPLRFEVEINQVARHRQISAKRACHFNSKAPQSKLIICSTPVTRNCSTTAVSS